MRRSSARCRAPAGTPPAEFGVAVDRSGPSPLFTGRTRARTARCPGARRALRGAGRTEHVRLDQVIPAAGPAYLHHMNGELAEPGGQQDQLLGGARRAGDGPQVVAKDPRDQGQLLLAADRAHHRTLLAVEFRGAQQVRIGVADLAHPGPPGVHLSQQGTPPKGVVHHLPLQSHGDQSTSAGAPPIRDRPQNSLRSAP